MLVTMKRQVFDVLDHEAIGEVCIEPAIQRIKQERSELFRGKEVTGQSQVYAQLTGGQRALLMFRVFYNHAHVSMADFYWRSAYFLAQPKTWSEIKAGLRYFGADAMLRVFEEMEGVLEASNHPRSLETFDVSHNHLDNDPELFTSVSPLYVTFHEIAPATLKRIGEYIRNNPVEFVKLED